LYLLEYRLLRSPADGDHQYHCGNADHDPDHGQGGPHLVRAEGLEGDLCSFEKFHTIKEAMPA